MPVSKVIQLSKNDIEKLKELNIPDITIAKINNYLMRDNISQLLEYFYDIYGHKRTDEIVTNDVLWPKIKEILESKSTEYLLNLTMLSKITDNIKQKISKIYIEKEKVSPNCDFIAMQFVWKNNILSKLERSSLEKIYEYRNYFIWLIKFFEKEWKNSSSRNQNYTDSIMSELPLEIINSIEEILYCKDIDDSKKLSLIKETTNFKNLMLEIISSF